MFATYQQVITTAINHHPRSLQVEIGPSEVGQACARRVGYKLLGQPERPGPPNWKATVGTATHAWLEAAFDADNLAHAAELGGQERWLIETKLVVGWHADGTPISGHCDLYDRLTATVIDHKTVGPTQLLKYKRHGPGEQYRIQAHLYGRGWQLAGYPVDTVAVCFLPRNGELADTYHWSEPYDEWIAVDGLTRLAGIGLATSMLGTGALQGLPTADDYCMFCPFHAVGSTDLAVGCPGHLGSAATTHTPALTLLD